MKKIITALFLLVICLLFLLGCTFDTATESHSIHPDADVQPASSAAGATSSGADSALGEATSSIAGELGTAADSSEPQVNSVQGIIADAGMGRYYVELDDGLVVGFLRDTADISGLTDTRPGSPIVVYFTGELEGNDTSNITVIAMETP